MGTSHSIDAGGLRLHVLEHGDPGGAPTVALVHGWLDHAHSFDWLVPHLPTAWRLLALDLRGHGDSDPLPAGGSHAFADHLADLEALVRHFSLERLHLVGHSLGGAVALGWAAARPARALSLTLIESLGTTGGDAARAPERLAGFLDGAFKPVRQRVYASVEEAARRVREANASYSEAAALHMATHGTRAVEGGVVFKADGRLKRVSGLAWDEAQVQAVCAAVRCRVQVVRGTAGAMLEDGALQGRLRALRDPPVIALEGGHHVHLDQPEAVARAIARFVTAAEAA